MAAANNGGFIERSIAGTISFLKESVFSDEYASRKGLLQSLDPRINFVTFVLCLLTILFTRSIAALIYLYAVSLVFAYLSRIDMAFFLKRTWIFIPLFSVFIAIPALFSAFTPGEAISGFNVKVVVATVFA